jgi:hypothetical protein
LSRVRGIHNACSQGELSLLQEKKIRPLRRMWELSFQKTSQERRVMNTKSSDVLPHTEAASYHMLSFSVAQQL